MNKEKFFLSASSESSEPMMNMSGIHPLSFDVLPTATIASLLFEYVLIAKIIVVSIISQISNGQKILINLRHFPSFPFEIQQQKIHEDTILYTNTAPRVIIESMFTPIVVAVSILSYLSNASRISIVWMKLISQVVPVNSIIC